MDRRQPDVFILDMGLEDVDCFKIAEMYKQAHDDRRYHQELKEIVRIDADAGPERTGRTRTLAARSALVLAELLGYYNLGEAGHAVVDRFIKLRPAIEYMEKHYPENITLEETAKVIFLSASRFRHLFQETMHVGFKEYLIGLRYQAAKKLLANSDLTVSEIADQAGFSNLYSFYKLFEQHEKMTPSDYRKQIREQ
jgi:AraC-like DNA-binding protein